MNQWVSSRAVEIGSARYNANHGEHGWFASGGGEAATAAPTPGVVTAPPASDGTVTKNGARTPDGIQRGSKADESRVALKYSDHAIQFHTMAESDVDVFSNGAFDRDSSGYQVWHASALNAPPNSMFASPEPIPDLEILDELLGGR